MRAYLAWGLIVGVLAGGAATFVAIDQELDRRPTQADLSRAHAEATAADQRAKDAAWAAAIAIQQAKQARWDAARLEQQVRASGQTPVVMVAASPPEPACAGRLNPVGGCLPNGGK